VLRFGFAKAKFTANAIYHQTLVAQAAQAVKADALKAARQASAVVAAMKEAASVAVNAEATGNQAVIAVADQVHQAEIVRVAREIVRVDKAAVIVQAEIARVDQERDNNYSRKIYR
jgi:hypothetical protein